MSKRRNISPEQRLGVIGLLTEHDQKKRKRSRPPTNVDINALLNHIDPCSHPSTKDDSLRVTYEQARRMGKSHIEKMIKDRIRETPEHLAAMPVTPRMIAKDPAGKTIITIDEIEDVEKFSYFSSEELEKPEDLDIRTMSVEEAFGSFKEAFGGFQHTVENRGLIMSFDNVAYLSEGWPGYEPMPAFKKSKHRARWRKKQKTAYAKWAGEREKAELEKEIELSVFREDLGWGDF